MNALLWSQNMHRRLSTFIKYILIGYVIVELTSQELYEDKIDSSLLSPLRFAGKRDFMFESVDCTNWSSSIACIQVFVRELMMYKKSYILIVLFHIQAIDLLLNLITI